MLTTKLINPEIIAELAKCGHGSKILIADGNYPLAEKTGNAKKVYLGVAPGLPTVTAVLEALHSVCNFEKAEVMLPEDQKEPPIFSEFRKELNLDLKGLNRWDFYDACIKDNAIILAISTGEKRVFANILLTIGVA